VRIAQGRIERQPTGAPRQPEDWPARYCDWCKLRPLNWCGVERSTFGGAVEAMTNRKLSSGTELYAPSEITESCPRYQLSGWAPVTTTEQILQELRTLPEAQAREVLDFVEFLKSRLPRGTSMSTQRDMSAFDRFGAVYEGRFNRDELYDRQVLR